jgi:hypothetical protein
MIALILTKKGFLELFDRQCLKDAVFWLNKYSGMVFRRRAMSLSDDQVEVKVVAFLVSLWDS